MSSRRVLVLLLVVGISVWGISLALGEDAVRYVHTPNSIQQPEGTLPLDTLLENAYQLGLATGLHSIEGQDYTWVTYGEWMGHLGIMAGRADPNMPVLVVAMRGHGIWSGAGLVGNVEIHGVTIALDGETGELFATLGGYTMPTGDNAVVYQQLLNHPTLAPAVDTLLRMTAMPSTRKPRPTQEPEITDEPNIFTTPRP